MARLIYAFLALSLGTLVAGFLIRDSSVPLLVSIGLSALVLLLILVGTSRRLRRSQELEDEQEELASLEIVEIDEDEAAAPEVTVAASSPSRTRSSRRRSAEDTQAMPAIEDGEDLAEPEATEVVEPPPKRSRRKAAARPPRRKAGTIVGAEPDAEPDVFPEFAVSDDESAAETEVDVAPPPRVPARSRRRAAAQASAPRDTEPATVGVDRPVLSPKVWVIPGRSRYHTQDCRFAKGDTLREVTEATAVRRGYVACSVCKPGSAG